MRSDFTPDAVIESSVGCSAHQIGAAGPPPASRVIRPIRSVAISTSGCREARTTAEGLPIDTPRGAVAHFKHRLTMPREDGLPPGTLIMLILRVLATEPLHGYAIAQRIHTLSREELSVEEGSLYPALQKLLLKGWVKAPPRFRRPGARCASIG